MFIQACIFFFFDWQLLLFYKSPTDGSKDNKYVKRKGGFRYLAVHVGVKGQSLLNKDLVILGLISTKKKK